MARKGTQRHGFAGRHGEFRSEKTRCGRFGRLGVVRTGGESLGGDGKGMLRKDEAGEARHVVE